jgi:hypothetical protein
MEQNSVSPMGVTETQTYLLFNNSHKANKKIKLATTNEHPSAKGHHSKGE